MDILYVTVLKKEQLLKQLTASPTLSHLHMLHPLHPTSSVHWNSESPTRGYLAESAGWQTVGRFPYR